MSQGYVAAVLAQQGDRSRALGLLQQARVIIARLLEQSPDNHQLSEDLAMFVDNIAKLEQAKAPGSGRPPRNRNRQSGKSSRKCRLMALIRHAQCADECPILGESGGDQPGLANLHLLPISIYKYTP